MTPMILWPLQPSRPTNCVLAKNNFPLLYQYNLKPHRNTTVRVALSQGCPHDLPTINLENIHLFIDILRILYMIHRCWCTSHNYMNPHCSIQICVFFQHASNLQMDQVKMTYQPQKCKTSTYSNQHYFQMY